MPRIYNVRSWYWLVGGETGVYSSADDAYVALDEAGYLAFLAEGNVATSIADATELQAVLKRGGVAYLGAAPLEADPEARVRARFSAAAHTLASANTDTIDFDSAVEYPSGVWGGIGNPNRINIPTGQTGLYDVRVFGVFDESSVVLPGVAGVGNRTLGFRQSGTGTQLIKTKVTADGEDETSFSMSREVELEGGTSYRVFARQNSGGDMPVAVECSIRRIE